MNISTKAAALVAVMSAVSVALPIGAAGAAPARGTLKICAHNGATFDIYAEGPSARNDDLVGEWDECTDWSRVRVGSYDIGYGVQLSNEDAAGQVVVRTRRNGHVWYKRWHVAFDDGFLGETMTAVVRNKTTRIDIFFNLAFRPTR